jgi:hypothetical protein
MASQKATGAVTVSGDDARALLHLEGQDQRDKAIPHKEEIQVLHRLKRDLQRDLAEALGNRDGRNERDLARIRDALEQVRLQIRQINEAA